MALELFRMCRELHSRFGCGVVQEAREGIQKLRGEARRGEGGARGRGKARRHEKKALVVCTNAPEIPRHASR